METDSELVGIMDLRLVRFASNDQGTQGYLFYEGEDEARFATLELPWRDNARSLSCIPVGRYECVWRTSPKFGPCYHLLDVPGRSNVLFHHGNFAGDRVKGLKADSQGCILVGMSHTTILGQRAIGASRFARTRFEASLERQKFLLTISEQS